MLHDPIQHEPMHRLPSSHSKAKVATKAIPVGSVILGVAVLYIALCLKVFSGF